MNMRISAQATSASDRRGEVISWRGFHCDRYPHVSPGGSLAPACDAWRPACAKLPGLAHRARRGDDSRYRLRSRIARVRDDHLARLCVRRRGLLEEMQGPARAGEAIAKAAKGERWTALLTRYGAGFYGIAALWTLVVVELLDFWAIVLDPGPFLELLSRGPNAWFGAFVRAQVEAITTAFTWFFYWGDEFYVAR